MKKNLIFLRKGIFIALKNLILIFSVFMLSAIITGTHLLASGYPDLNKFEQQLITVSGVVTDADDGQPIPGVNITVKGTNLGTITDFDGVYTIEDLGEGNTLVFSFVGYKTVEKTIGVETKINVVLETDSKGLDEIVVVGYGTKKKVNLTGSVAVIDAKSLEARPITNVSMALQGLMPGATIIQNGGQPGKDGASIRIRGVGTLNNANPMYVIDGIVRQSINDIDPNDIESISILKDAASASIYGSRASNGVVLITTKKGNSKGTTVKYDMYVGWQKPTDMLEYLPSWKYAELYNKARITQGQPAAYTPEEIELFRNGSDPDNYPNTDWLGLFYKDRGYQENHRAEISGGNENSTYLFSLGYLNQKGIIEHANFKRYNARTNISTKYKKISAGVNLAFTNGNTEEPNNPYTGDMYQIFRQVNRIAPFVPYKYSNGYYGYITDGNPLAWMDLGGVRKEQYLKTSGVGNIAYEPIEGLKIQEIIGYEYKGSSDESFVKDIQFYNWQTENPTLYQGPNSQKETRQVYQMINLQTLITYDKTFGKHNIGVLAGYSQEHNRTDWNRSYRRGFLNNNLWEINAGSTDGQSAEGSAFEFSLRSYFGRLSYNFNDKYLLEANIRYDGTSRIVKSEQWGTFPSFSAGWRIINESFMESIKPILSDLKIRAGWGLLGNQNVGTRADEQNLWNYPYQSVLSAANYNFGGSVAQGVALVNGVNEKIMWESSETWNIGVDIGFLSNQITLLVDFYNRRTYDVLLRLPVSTPYGLSEPFQNAGEIVNKGVEMQLGYKLTRGAWSFDVLANAAYNKNEIIDLKNDKARIWRNGFSFYQEGYSVNSFGGYEAEGLFRSQTDLDNSAVINSVQAGLGDIKYKDQNGDGIINAEDRVSLGSWTPAWTFGASFGASWKGIDIQLFLQGAADVKGYLLNESVGRLQGNSSKPTTMFDDSYDEVTNPDGNFPRPLSTWLINDSEAYPSSFWIVDASYLRLKSLQVGYTLPTKFTKFARISKARIYFSGHNLLTFSKLRKGFDPEAPAGARAYFPQVKTSTFGISLTF